MPYIVYKAMKPKLAKQSVLQFFSAEY